MTTEREPSEDEIQELKTTLIIAVILLMLVSVALIFTALEISKYEDITEGEYITIEQCDQIYANIAIPITKNITNISTRSVG